MMNADEERGYPRRQPIPGKRDTGGGQADATPTRQLREKLPHCSQGILADAQWPMFAGTAYWLTNSESHEECNEHPRKADDEKRHAPAEGVIDPPTQPVPYPGADRNTTRIERQDGGTF